MLIFFTLIRETDEANKNQKPETSHTIALNGLNQGLFIFSEHAQTFFLIAR